MTKLVDIFYTPDEPRHAYDPACPHCRPAFVNPETGETFDGDHPAMVGVMRIWNSAPFKERQAFISVTVDNSRDERDLVLAKTVMKRMSLAFEATRRSSTS